ncbi:Zn(2)-C6 fungal-type domain-containing protein [Mycena sanguinolenta]|uniref:Zn(2)-C6 fungal-type domain-containing protein n=1 Tax=Mycena sanguinolenta TaxID=230812 RepID=A0A8H6Z9S3_9AGAR|nr:Zn(2)-C6 fungal-type domain-containing protein [Mycena sanguinolenta]
MDRAVNEVEPNAESSKILVHKATLSFLKYVCSTKFPRFQTLVDGYMLSMVSDGVVSAIVDSLARRKRLLDLSSELGLANDPKLRAAIRTDDEGIATLLEYILGSEPDKEAVLRLEGDSAQCFLDAVQECLDKGFLLEHRQAARHLIRKVSEACDRLPSSLFISGVSECEENASFGGGYGDIYCASYGGKRVALKRLRHFLRGSDLRRVRLKFCREALVWRDLHHPYILEFFGIDRDSFPEPYFCMVSPWKEHGTVLNYLKRHGLANVDKLLYEIAQGLQYLHARNIVHGDLRGANILINDDWSACLADFGLSSFSDSNSSTSTRGGSLYWMAPELFDPDRFGYKFIRTPATDVYAFGCVLCRGDISMFAVNFHYPNCIQLYTGQHPFPNLSEAAALLKVIDGERPERPSSPAMSDALWQHVTECWAPNPTKRPATDLVVQHMVWPIPLIPPTPQQNLERREKESELGQINCAPRQDLAITSSYSKMGQQWTHPNPRLKQEYDNFPGFAYPYQFNPDSSQLTPTHSAQNLGNYNGLYAQQILFPNPNFLTVGAHEYHMYNPTTYTLWPITVPSLSALGSTSVKASPLQQRPSSYHLPRPAAAADPSNAKRHCVPAPVITNNELKDNKMQGEKKGSARAKLPEACTRCKNLKAKCELKNKIDPCKRCFNGGHDCVTPARQTLPQREHLLNQIREQAAEIQKLMAQLEQNDTRQHTKPPSFAATHSFPPTPSSPPSSSADTNADPENDRAVEDWIAKARDRLAGLDEFIGMDGVAMVKSSLVMGDLRDSASENDEDGAEDRPSPAMSDALWQHVTEFRAPAPTGRPATDLVVQNMVWPIPLIPPNAMQNYGLERRDEEKELTQTAKNPGSHPSLYAQQNSYQNLNFLTAGVRKYEVYSPIPDNISPITATSLSGLWSPTSVTASPSLQQQSSSYYPLRTEAAADPSKAKRQRVSEPAITGNGPKDDEMYSESEEAGARVKVRGACIRCKNLKVKCQFETETGPCKRCFNGGHKCATPGRKKRGGPPKREHLLCQIREQAQEIQKLMAQLEQNDTRQRTKPPSFAATHSFPPTPSSPASSAPASYFPSNSTDTNTGLKSTLAMEDWIAKARDRFAGIDGFMGMDGVEMLKSSLVKEDSQDSASGDDGAEDLLANGDEPEEEEVEIKVFDSEDEKVTRRSRGKSANIFQLSTSSSNEDSGGKKLAALPSEASPFGFMGDLSLKKGPNEESDDESAPALADSHFFRSSPAPDPMRSSNPLSSDPAAPHILTQGLITPQEAGKLFDIYFQRMNLSVSLLDPVLYMPQKTCYRSPFLFTVVCAIASRLYTERPEIYPQAMHFAELAANGASINAHKGVDSCLGYILMALYPVPVKRGEEERDKLYLGLAISMATDLNLHLPNTAEPIDEAQSRRTGLTSADALEALDDLGLTNAQPVTRPPQSLHHILKNPTRESAAPTPTRHRVALGYPMHGCTRRGSMRGKEKVPLSIKSGNRVGTFAVISRKTA